MNDTVQPPAAMPWFKSNIYRGLAIVVVTMVLKYFKVDQFVSSDQIATTVDIGLALIGAIGVIVTGVARNSQKHAPVITLTQKKADVINLVTPPPPTSSQNG